MGGPMAANLVAAGHTVRGFDPVAALRDAAAEAKGASGLRQRRRRRRRRRRGDHLAAQRRHREGLLRRDAARRKGRRAVDRHLDDLGRRRPRDPSAGGRGRARPARRARCRAASRARPRARWPSWSAVTTPTSSAPGPCWIRWRARSFTAARPAPDRPPSCATTWCWPFSRSPIGEAFVLAEKLGLSAQSLFDVITGATGQLLGGAHQLPGAGAGSDVTGEQRLQARLRYGADEQGPRPGDGRGDLGRIGCAAGHARRRDLR